MDENMTKDELRDRLEPQMKKYRLKDRLLTPEELPVGGFDVTESLSNDLRDYGIPTELTKLGTVVVYSGNATITVGNTTINMNNCAGEIAGQANGRIVILTQYGYFGWLTPEQYRTVNFIESQINTKH